MTWVLTDPVNSILVEDVPKAIRDVKTGILDEDTMSSDSATDVCSQQSIKAFIESSTVTLENKTLTSPVLNGSISGDAFLDEDTFSSDSAVKVASQQSIKEWVTDGAIEMTNKQITQLVINTGISGSAIKDEDTMSSDSTTKLCTQQSIKAYVDSLVTSETQLLKCWGHISGRSDNDACTVNANLNISGATRTGEGLYTITWDTDFSSSNYAISFNATAKIGSSSTELYGYIVSLATGSANIGFQDNNGSKSDPVTFTIMAAGAQ